MKFKPKKNTSSLSAKLLIISLFILSSTTSLFSQKLTEYTSFKPGGQWLADDGVHIDSHGGNIIYVESEETYYWYGEHRGTPRGASCYSSKDLYNWKNEGVVLEKGEIEVFERPKVVYDEVNKKYVMWFHFDNSAYRTAELGVATSDNPTGPFVVQDHYRPNGHESRDIGMYFEPDTKKAYIGYAADHINRTIRMVELSVDYLSTTANDVDIEAHCEGPGILKKNGKFYLLTSGCSGWTPNPATYYTAENIMGHTPSMAIHLSAMQVTIHSIRNRVLFSKYRDTKTLISTWVTAGMVEANLNQSMYFFPLPSQRKEKWKSIGTMSGI
ncbi:family 43 glycosylhydrolase [Algoriphagus persicinus]|uniref:family 43 glycosylhydrolase n=1 Tax=Algoriphagus persicinus TaxID=3108754 RepID=UPI002B3C5782|nr:family 43 glycosylhydrolase [Algoriphagus sp. E1-3-M2]MEB2785976.1 family 43 glycosylhydrolase [Algoriphagus sp. E1-3-M2]